MNKIFETILDERNGHYCHCLEVSNAYDLEGIVENMIDNYGDTFTEEEYIDFFESMEIYYLSDNENEASETAVYDFSFRKYIEGTL